MTKAMEKDLGRKITDLKVDGGADLLDVESGRYPRYPYSSS